MRNQPKFTTSTLTPTIIPSAPGYRVVRFYVEGGITPETTVADIKATQNIIVAWLATPMLRLDEGHFAADVVDHGLEPLYPFGGSSIDEDLIVDPMGQWNAFEDTFLDEASARAWWLDRMRRKAP